jgi:hypothetical protein
MCLTHTFLMTGLMFVVPARSSISEDDNVQFGGLFNEQQFIELLFQVFSQSRNRISGEGTHNFLPRIRCQSFIVVCLSTCHVLVTM